ncbi:hypothetical protein HWC59_gp13 [Proteus phage Myduc]|uniref:Uncharacterized protein n=1 Tax=Proteus phage Myduc TaxID=2650874 RepID=A0A5J6TAU6_9CAUD|nr:hypothetical protein HWC59_gp13 [Proteus phage Myduc]QFG06636.1 hypothetical protein CPT_Myduc_013 [Proteus phage Myduc]
MTRVGDSLVCQIGCSLKGFSAYKIYKVIAGTGDANMSPTASRFGMNVHSENSCNVLDDNGEIRFVTLSTFRPIKEEFGVLDGLFKR